MKKYSIVTVCMIVVIATAVQWRFLHTEADQNARKKSIQEDWEKKFWGGLRTRLVKSSETQVIFFVFSLIIISQIFKMNQNFSLPDKEGN